MTTTRPTSFTDLPVDAGIFAAYKGMSPPFAKEKRMNLTRLMYATFGLVVALATVASAAVKTETVEYKVGDQTYKGFLAYDDAVKSKRPGVLVAPEWWGLNDYPKSRAKQLAELGYVAFVADYYGDGKTTEDANEAGKLASAVRPDPVKFRALGQAALRELKARPEVDPSKIAAIGYCFGGSAVLELARDGADLKGVVSFHGALATGKPAKEGDVKARVLALHGADDSFVKEPEVDAFEKEMAAAKVDYRLVSYPGAEHAFTNPGVDTYNLPGAKYNADADKASWEAMSKFLADVLK
jgi:dienelactone hydrolase